MDEMIVVARAVRRGVARALVSCDFPFGPLQEGTASALRAAIRLVKEAGVDMVKLDGAADFPEAVRAIVRAGIPVFAQFGITPQTALQYGVDYAAMLNGAVQVPDDMTARAGGGGEDASRPPAHRCSTSPARGRWSGPRSPDRSAFPSSAASAADRGSMGGCAWRTPPSATARAISTPGPRPMPMSRASPWRRSPPTPTTCAPADRSRAAFRRDERTVVPAYPAAAPRRPAREAPCPSPQLMASSPITRSSARARRSSCSRRAASTGRWTSGASRASTRGSSPSIISRSTTAASSSTAARRASPGVASSASAGITTRPRGRAFSTIWASIARTSWVGAWVAPRWRPSR